MCNGVAVVDRELCVGCGMCAKTCPNHLISIIPKSSTVFVGCSSHEITNNTLCGAYPEVLISAMKAADICFLCGQKHRCEVLFADNIQPGHPKIAEAMDLPINTVKTKIRRAKAQLLKMMDISDELL